jgi:hypothetical protein
MNRTMRVDIRQDRLHATSFRRKTAETQQRIESHDTVCEAAQPRHLGVEHVDRSAAQANKTYIPNFECRREYPK